MSRQRDYQLRHKAAGLCQSCSRPIFWSDRCAEHYTQHRDRLQARYHLRHPEARYYRVRRDAGADPGALA